jgi:alanine dehydrogenase
MKAFAHAGVRDAHHFRGRLRHRVLVVADDVAEQRHLGQRAALRFGGVADRAQVALVQVLQAGQAQAFEFRLAVLRQAVEVILDLDDRRDRIARLAEEFQRHGARELRHLVQDPAARGDQAVGALLLDARQAGQEFVGHVLAQALLAEAAAFDRQRLGAERRALWVRPSPTDASIRV